MAMIWPAPGRLSTVIESTRCSLVSTRWIARAIRSFSPPGPAPTTNSTFPAGFHGAAGCCACAAGPKASNATEIAASEIARANCMFPPRQCFYSAVITAAASADQRRIRQKADRRTGLDRGNVLAKFSQAVGLGQRRNDARAILRVLDRLDGAVGGRTQRNADIFAAPLAFLVGERGARRHRHPPLRQRTGKPQQQRPHHAHKSDEHRDRASRQSDERRAVT